VTSQFFEEQEEQSAIKSDIVVSYFGAWASIMASRAKRLEYLDPYAGPGAYAHGEKSTPVLIAERVLSSAALRQRVQMRFSDANPAFAEKLRAELERIPALSELTYRPEITCQEVDDAFAARLTGAAQHPRLTFLDPWGYRGLSRPLIGSLIRGFGCETIFFFNYNRISAAVVNTLVEPHMQAIFEPVRLAQLQEALRVATGVEREHLIMRALGDSLESIPTGTSGQPLLVPFRFRGEGRRVSHYICFLTKSRVGYRIMKEVMAARGVCDSDGVPKFEYVPSRPAQQLSFDVERPLTLLGDDLLRTFRGQTLEVREMVDRHNIGTPFITPNYKQVLLELEDAGRIGVRSTKSRRPKGTMGDENLITFPE
jgi:three-Cys-motif partner protein